MSLACKVRSRVCVWNGLGGRGRRALVQGFEIAARSSSPPVVLDCAGVLLPCLRQGKKQESVGMPLISDQPRP